MKRRRWARGFQGVVLRVRPSQTWQSSAYAILDLPFDQFQLELGDRLGGIQPLGAGLGAIHDRVAAIEPERVFEIVEPFAGGPSRESFTQRFACSNAAGSR